MRYDKDSIKKRKNRMNNVKKILYVILIILIYNIILVGISYISRQDFNGIFGYKAYNITTNSMEPNINKGDIILIKKPKKEEKIKIGDVISFKNDGQIITHRIVDISDTNGVLIIYLYSLNTKEKSEIRRAKRMKYMEENHNNKL